MQHKVQYNTGAAVQDNAAQQWWYSTILAANTISNTGKFAKMVLPDFFCEGGARSPHPLCYRKLMIAVSLKILAIRKTNHPLYSTISPSSAYYHYFHSLLIAPTNKLPPPP